LKFFWLIETDLQGIPVTISRTGYSGDLGYEIWTNHKNALDLWDILMSSGSTHGITPAGLNALDMARIEASLILLDVDYISSRHALIESRKSSPYELNLGWAVKMEKQDFIGKSALMREKKTKTNWKLRGIEIQWGSLEKEFNKVGLPPGIPTKAWRTSTAIYSKKKQIGYATSGCWSPILKRYIALAHLNNEYSTIGSYLDFEIKIEHIRHLIPAQIVQTPFFNPERKRSCPK
jgi:aminomethyltransferase